MARWLLPAFAAALAVVLMPSHRTEAQTALVLPGGCAPASLYTSGTQQLTMAPDGTLCTQANVVIPPVTATTAADASATPTPVLAGPAKPLNIDLFSSLFVRPTLSDGTPVDPTHGLEVNCIAGCAGGTFNNNADGVATSATNGQSAVWLYGWNGASFDRINDGNPSADPAHPLATQIMVSDNTNLQRVLSPLILGDGVNGNNMVSVGSWMWNGVTWDRVRGAAATGLTVRASNLPTTVDTNAGAAGANTIRVVLGTGGSAVSSSNFPATVDTNAGAAGASTIRVVTATNSPVNVAQFGGTNAVTGGVNGSVGVGGLAASGVAVAGNPLLSGCRAATTIPTAVADGQAVSVECGTNGKVTVIPYSIKENATGGGNVTITGSGAQTIIAASGVAGVLTYVTSLQCNNTGTAAVTVLANDTWTSNFIVPPAGGTNLTFPVPLRTAANTAFTLTGSAGGTGGTITCNAQGYKGN